MNIPFWLLRLLPMWDYLCPKCRSKVKQKSHKCPYCGENYDIPLRVPPKVLKEKKALSDYVHKHIFPKVSQAHRDYLTQFFTEIFSDGFESGDFSAWTGTTGAVSVVTTDPHHGTYCMKADWTAPWQSNAAYKDQDFGTTLFGRIYFKVSQMPTDTNYDITNFLEFWDNSRKYYGIKRVGANDWRWVVRDQGTTTDYVSASNIGDISGVWHCIEGKLVESATVGELHLWADGVEVVTATGLNTGTMNIWRASVACDAWDSAETITAYVDCVVVADAYIGPEAAGGLSIPVAMYHYNRINKVIRG